MVGAARHAAATARNLESWTMLNKLGMNWWFVNDWTHGRDGLDLYLNP
jgi:hypothetical protein